MARRSLREGHVQSAASSLFGRPPSSGMHEDLPHRSGCHAEEVGAILPGMVRRRHQVQIRLVHERRRVERFTRPSVPDDVCKAPELVVDLLVECVKRLFVAVTSGVKEGRY